jgi:hypothetical protein
MFARAGRSFPIVRVASACAVGAVALNLEQQHRGPAYAAAPPSAPAAALTAPGGGSLKLTGHGMRRKNLFITEVDVYVASCYMNDAALKSVKGKGSDSGTEKLPDALMSVSSGFRDNTPVVAVNSKFVRDVGKDKIVESFNEAFKGCSPTAVASLKASLGEVLGDKGMAKGEEFQFFWYTMDNRGLVIVKDGKVKETEASADMNALKKRLLNVYLGANAVSPELVKAVAGSLNE